MKSPFLPILCRPRVGRSLALLVGVALSGWAVTPVDEVRAKEPKRRPAVRVVHNLAYYAGDDADPVRHRLDLYLPAGRKGFPVLFMIHGGAWQHGDKNHFGIYAALGQCLARHGVGMVSINYRLSPSVRHPEHVKDVARAFAWTYRNIEQYGGRRDELFVGGHSAGGHLAALLATDETYLKGVGLDTGNIRGVVPISGLYTIPDFPVLHRVFGKEPAALRAASPLTYVRAGLPPFLIIYSDHELPGCEGPGAQAFCRALCGKACQAQTFEAVHRNHISVLVNAMYDDDPVMRRMLGFIASEVTLHRLLSERGGADFLGSLLAAQARP